MRFVTSQGNAISLSYVAQEPNVRADLSDNSPNNMNDNDISTNSSKVYKIYPETLT